MEGALLGFVQNPVRRSWGKAFPRHRGGPLQRPFFVIETMRAVGAYSRLGLVTHTP